MTIATAQEPAEFQSNFERPELIQWKAQSSTIPFSSLGVSKIKLAPCAEDSGNLYPVHPYQSTKVYHVNYKGTYKAGKLKADDPLCIRGNTIAPNPQFRNCFYAVNPQHVEMSDYYMDRCGNYYRGAWENNFLIRNKTDDHPYLLSKGRVNHMINRGTYSDSEDADTYAVPVKEFQFFAPITAEEKKKIEEIRERALKTGGYVFDKKSFLFLKKKNNAPASTPANAASHDEDEAEAGSAPAY